MSGGLDFSGPLGYTVHAWPVPLLWGPPDFYMRVSVDGKKPLGLIDQAAFFMLWAASCLAGNMTLYDAPAARFLLDT